ncbi:transposase [Thermococcus sp. M39]|uniref:RNA-guided endonuclease InsQ/TnpB family protein n=1 Tax=Thermococcus sp. M39 TaxID=1638262 RepID=UPI003211EFED
MLLELLDYAFENKVKSHVKLRKALYEKLKEEYPKLPTHYIYTACQDAVTRMKSLLEHKKKGKAETEKPEVRKVSIWLDDVLWDYKRFPQFTERGDGLRTLIVRVSTKNGRITIPFKPHKLFFHYLDSGWKLKANVKLQMDFERKAVYAFLTFQKTVRVPELTGKYLAIDYNLNNITTAAQDFVLQIKTNLGRQVEVYSEVYRKIQTRHLVGWRRKTLSKKGKKLLSKFGSRRKNRRLDVQRKLAKKLVEVAGKYGLTIAVEDLGRNFNQRITRKKKGKKIRNKLHNISANGFLKALEEKALEFGVPLVKVNPAFTSQVCPSCGAFRVKPDEDALRQRVFKCPICGFEADRDFVAVQNLLGLFPFSPKAHESPVEDSVSPVMLVVEANLLHHKNALIVIAQELQQ